MPTNESDYRPIRDYAVIGDCHGSALVSRCGSVDWGCLKRFDADPVFLKLLDADRGGYFSIQPREQFSSDQSYIESTNILQTTFKTDTGIVTVSDFMPVGRQPGSSTHDYVSLVAPGWLVRIVEGVEGRVPMRAVYRPSVDFARRQAELTHQDGCIVAADGPRLYLCQSPTIEGDAATCEFEIGDSECSQFILASRPLINTPSVERTKEVFEITKAFWTEWSGYCRYRGSHQPLVLRSALLLKLLTYAPTGALVAAPTCSLPEEMGGSRNWDYRYCWLRDSAFMLYALAVLGYGGEARQFGDFLRSCWTKSLPMIQIMYGIETETDLTENELTHLDGYGGSRPVRTGNGAYDQQQIDVFGEVLDWAHLFHTLGGRFDRRSKHVLEAFVDYVVAHWYEPDHGVWEIRGNPRHHVFGKVMCWVALDRALSILGHRDDWALTKAAIAQDIRTKGVTTGKRRFRSSYEENDVDAVLLLLPILGFPISQEILANTVDAIEEHLRDGYYLKRYEKSDGIEGGEGAFLICSFWLVDALLCLDRADAARSLFDDLCGRANHVGLFSEEIDPRTHAFLGNFPQAFTHLGLVGAAINLQIYEQHGAEGLRGRHADRARRNVGATLGWRGLWSAFRASGRIGRFVSSPHSILPPSLLW